MRAIVFAFLGVSCALAQTAEQVEFFEKKVRPVLATQCQACHNTRIKTAGLDLSTAQGFLAGGQSGSLIDKDDPERSRFLGVLSYDERLKMPPTAKLKDDVLADLKVWVTMGAPWPGAASVTAPPPKPSPGRQLTAEEKQFWAFQPVRASTLPPVRDKTWVRTPVDQFILAALEAKGLKPAPPASRTTLLRRATFDLTGLPPTETEIRDYVVDRSPDAFAKVVDRLLASPRYGERWGRHWLDVARYADSTGNDEDHRYPYAWRYRDYVIESFNNDLPFDQFIREQVAGDLMPAPDGSEVNRRGRIATGLLALGPKAIAQQDKKKMLYDVYDEQIDVVSKAFLGVTLACARCHDHKFDPLTTKDYYSMAGMFASTRSFKDPESHVSRLLYVPLAPKEVYDRYQAHQDKLTQKKLEIDDVIDEEKERYTAKLIPRLKDYMVAARRVYADGADQGAAAREAGLDSAILAKWVWYLKPAPGSTRTHFDEWDKAAGNEIATVAGAYQQRFTERSKAWSTTLAEWRERVRRMLREMNMPPPEKPKFDETTDPFFHEVFIRPSGPFSVSEKDQEAIFPQAARETLARLRGELDELKKASPPEPDMACAVEDGEIVSQRVFIRGDYGSPGEAAPKTFPEILSSADDPVVKSGSGRLELAAWLTRPDHRLTWRVAANRIWAWHFSEGIVRTTDNFGKMGERPTHPELLDWLARELVANGYSVKKLHRTIMLSSAYQMSGEASKAAVEADQDNRLLTRFPRRRLDVEEIRDGMLALDGSLDTTMGGTLQSGFGTDGENSNSRLSLNPETNRRRMVYLPLRRANLATILNLFDFGDAVIPQSKRALTTVAPQALFMMNSGFVAERSRNLAGQVLATSDGRARLESLYLRTVNREATPDEIDAALTYIGGFRERFPSAAEADAWQSLSRILLASNNFIYVD